MTARRNVSMLAVLLPITLLTSGCPAQVPTVPVLSCPSAATVGTYTPLNPTTPATATTYTDSGQPSGSSWCYVVQWAPDGKLADGTSAPSNVAGPLTLPQTAVTHEIGLSWTAPAATGAYVVSRVAAISTVPTAPSLNASPTVSEAQPGQASPSSRAMQASTTPAAATTTATSAPTSLMARVVR